MTYPFFYFYDLEFDKQALLDFVLTVPENEWLSPHIGNYDKSIPLGPHIYDNLLWTANNRLTDFTKCDEIMKIFHYFNHNGKSLINNGMLLKRTKNGYTAPFRSLMQNEEYDKKRGYIRTFDIIVPIFGGFEKDPVQAYDTFEKEFYVMNPIGKAFMVPSDPTWHYKWTEAVYEFRYTLHLRSIMPITYEMVEQVYG